MKILLACAFLPFIVISCATTQDPQTGQWEVKSILTTDDLETVKMAFKGELDTSLEEHQERLQALVSHGQEATMQGIDTVTGLIPGTDTWGDIAKYAIIALSGIFSIWGGNRVYTSVKNSEPGKIFGKVT